METPISKGQRRTSREQFDRQAAHYDAQWNAWSSESLEWMIRSVKLTSAHRILDVATGSGFTALAMAAIARDVVGIDVSDGMLEQARSRAAESKVGNVRFQNAAAESIPFDDGVVDVVTCRIAAHHFKDVRSFAAECVRVLAPGGSLLIADTSAPDDEPEAARWMNAVEFERDRSHFCNYTPKQWREIVEDAGFKVVQMTDEGAGIVIPLDDWMRKAGCTSEQEARVRAWFEGAPESARRIFQIRLDELGNTVFTWKRILIKAVKS